MSKNLILLTDSYKVSHWAMLPKNTTSIYSYLEARNPSEFSNETVFFGLQYLLQEYLSKPITRADIDEADRYFSTHFGNDKIFNRAGVEPSPLLLGKTLFNVVRDFNPVDVSSTQLRNLEV